MKRKPCTSYKLDDKGRMIFYYPCWIEKITEDYVVIRDSSDHTKAIEKWLFEKHWEPEND